MTTSDIDRALERVLAEHDGPVDGLPAVGGDHLNARRFLREHGDDVRRAPELGRWFLWTGSWWEADRLDRVAQLATATIENLRSWVAESANPDEFRRRSRHYDASTRAGRRDALLSLVGTDPKVVVAVDQLDARPTLLACRNGTVDLTTGDLQPASRDDLLTRGIDVDYDPHARSAEWVDFVEHTFGADAELIAFVQRLLGYCISGLVHEHVLPVLHGAGANGKSTLIGVVQDLLGDHAITAPDGLVIATDHAPHPERIAHLRGRRLVVSHELEERAVLAEQAVKTLTGGDTLSARELYGRRFNFKPTHKVLLVTNHRPRVRGTDHAIWRRIRLVPFDVVVPPDRQDPDLRRRLLEEHGSAVLAWLVEGAVRWHREGLGSAERVSLATDAYRRASDVFGAFLEERTEAVPRMRTKVGDLWASWRNWCEEVRERPGRKQDFAAALDERGFLVETYQNAKSVVGIEIIPDQGRREVGEVS